MSDPKPTFTKTGTPATEGICPVCGTGLYRMGKTDAHEGLEPPERASRPKRRSKKRKGKLVIVESPAKARTVGRFLGRDYNVMASIGHVRDLLRSKLSVDVENEFQPRYRVPNEKREVVSKLKKAASKAEEVYIATDPDREGEAIAWHLLEAAEIEDERLRRVVFHEITAPAIKQAFSNPRGIAMDRVDAQQARRILDRLVGYKLSPLLWQKVRSRLSAGRVQSVALRLVVEREREIRDFVPEEYWSLDASFLHPKKPPAFRALLAKIDGKDPELGSKAEVDHVISALERSESHVKSVRRGTRTRRPSPPFTTSTLQQAASRRFGFTARKTMAIAQQLYEGIDLGRGERTGLITYMRTDSTQVSDQAVAEARREIEKQYGANYLPDKPPRYRTKSKLAQEAHEAIRPTSSERSPDAIRGDLSKDQYRLYTLIWQRFIASQMKPAKYDTLTIEVEGSSDDRTYLFRATASSLRFPGYLAVYRGDETANGETSPDAGSERRAELDQLPDLERGDVLELQEFFPEQHFTQAPARFSDATLVRELEEHGVGRPSTYAPIISTLRRRGYVVREKRRLAPTEIGEVVNDLLVAHFPNIVDTGFTARMEQELDEVAGGEREWVEVVREFYEPFEKQLEQAERRMPEVKPEPKELGRDCPECGNPLIIRHGRYGKFIGCSNFPECRYTEPLLEKVGVKCPEDGGDIVERRTRKGRVFYGCSNYPECEFTSWKRPLTQPCPNCGGVLVEDDKEHAKCLQCEQRVSVHDLPASQEEMA
jgi:DNA topoisomerase-1